MWTDDLRSGSGESLHDQQRVLGVDHGSNRSTDAAAAIERCVIVQVTRNGFKVGGSEALHPQACQACTPAAAYAASRYETPALGSLDVPFRDLLRQFLEFIVGGNQRRLVEPQERLGRRDGEALVAIDVGVILDEVPEQHGGLVL